MFDVDPGKQRLDEITEKIIGAAISVHRELRPGLLESTYEECLCYEVGQLGLNFERQGALPVCYKEVKLDCGFRMDLVVERSVIIEIKAVERLIPGSRSATTVLPKARGFACWPLNQLPCSRSEERPQEDRKQFLNNSASPRLGG